MEWTMAHDILLCRELLAINPSRLRGKPYKEQKYGKWLFSTLKKLKNPPSKLQ